MIRTPVTSSNIRAVGYDAATQALEIEFVPDRFGQPVIWRYAPVSAETHAAIMAAPSIGGAFHEHVRKAGVPGVRTTEESEG